MSDNESNNQDKVIDGSSVLVDEAVIIEPSSVDSENPPENKKSQLVALWILNIISLVIIICLCFAGAWMWQQGQVNDLDSKAKIDTRLSELDVAIKETDNRLSRINSDLNEQNEAFKKNVDSLLQTILQNANENKALNARIADLSGRRPADWLLAEADYLVRIAGRKLWLENDVQTAMLMLQSADSRLEDLADPSLFPVRKLLAEDIQTLHQINPVSTNSLALALTGMISQVDSLPLNALETPEIEEDTEQKQLSDDVSDWRSNLSKTWSAIVDDFIQVETSDKPIQPYLSEKQRWLITEQLKLALAQAKSAALNGQETLFTSSLQQATAIIVEHFQLSETSVTQFADALQQLQNTDIAKEYPRQLASANALKDVIEQRIQSVFQNKSDEGAL